jgi:peptidoglycan/LPS O-acetylase OafA/YrhL
VGNYRFAIRGTDYLNADAAPSPSPSPLQHYWSLGVEEQFYLLWPALIIGTAWIVHRRSRRPAASTVPVMFVLAVIAAASFAISLSWTRTLPPWAFFSLPTRAWELAAGGMVALSAAGWRRLPQSAAAIAGAAGMTLILITCTQLGEKTPYPGTAALAPVLGTALMIVAGGAAPGQGVSRLLALAPMRAIGRLSYSWYLWHWPVLLLAPPLLGHPLGLAERLVAAAVSGALAAATLVFIENPARFATPLRIFGARSLVLGGALTAVTVCVGLVLLMLNPAPVGHGAAAPAVTIRAPDPTTASANALEVAVQQATEQVRAALAA